MRIVFGPRGYHLGMSEQRHVEETRTTTTRTVREDAPETTTTETRTVREEIPPPKKPETVIIETHTEG